MELLILLVIGIVIIIYRTSPEDKVDMSSFAKQASAL